MRTVTFSNKKIAALVNDNFIATWMNRNPKFHNCDFSEERRIVSNSFDCFSTKNFCTFFVTPRNEVLHYFSGYYSPDMFRDELKFVLKLRKAVLDDNGHWKRGGLRKYRALHRDHALRHRADANRVQKIKWPKRGEEGYEEFYQNQVQYRARQAYLLEGLRYLERLHKWLEASGRKVQLSQVLKNYRGGNEFTEE